MSRELGTPLHAGVRTFEDADRPATLPGTESVELDGELLVIHPDTGTVHRLDRIGGVLFPFLDGSATVAELVADVAAAFDADPGTVAADLGELLAELDRRRLLARDADADPVSPPNAAEPLDDPPPRRYLIDPRSPCAGSLDALPWATPVALHVGPDWGAVLAPTAELGEAIAAAAVVPTVLDADAPGFLYIFPAEGPDRFHRLHRAGCLAGITADPRRLLVMAGRNLAAMRPAPRGLQRVAAAGVLVDGAVTLVPRPLEERLLRHHRRLHEAGAALLDAPSALVDLEHAEVVVPDDDLFDVARVAALEAVLPPVRRREPWVPPGRYPLARWLFFDVNGPPWESLSRPIAVARASDTVRGTTISARSLRRLASVFESVEAASVNPRPAAATVDAVVGR